ncbi:MAG: hypothetical protein ACD_48C00372G0002 [uncultured bacterium]|nr:MAG: hypothetical protein ACD_48C00372G0002 [uncultured bacterium]
MDSMGILASTTIFAFVPDALVARAMIPAIPATRRGAKITSAIMTTIFFIDGGAFCWINMVIEQVFLL